MADLKQVLDAQTLEDDGENLKQVRQVQGNQATANAGESADLYCKEEQKHNTNNASLKEVELSEVKNGDSIEEWDARDSSPATVCIFEPSYNLAVGDELRTLDADKLRRQFNVVTLQLQGQGENMSLSKYLGEFYILDDGVPLDDSTKNNSAPGLILFSCSIRGKYARLLRESGKKTYSLPPTSSTTLR